MKNKIKISMSSVGKHMKTSQIAWQEFYNGRKGILFFGVLMALFFFWFLTIFDPNLFAGMEEVFEAYPDFMKEMVGGTLSIGTLGGFIHVYLFSLAWMYFGIYFILKASQDIPKEIENKTIDLVLSKPIKRWQLFMGKYFKHVAATLFIVFLTALLVFIGVFALPNIDVSELYLLDYAFAFLWMFVFLVALVSTAYLFSTFLNSRMALAVSFGVIIFLYAIGSFAALMPEEIQGIRFFSIFFYYNTGDMLRDHIWEFQALHLTFLIVYSVVITTIAGIIFNKRDIPV